MIKNILVIGFLCWASFSFAKTVVVQESVSDAESFRVEKPQQEKKGRALAGEKKKKKPAQTEWQDASEENSDVRYWQYQE